MTYLEAYLQEHEKTRTVTAEGMLAAKLLDEAEANNEGASNNGRGN